MMSTNALDQIYICNCKGCGMGAQYRFRGFLPGGNGSFDTSVFECDDCGEWEYGRDNLDRA